jgi:hypothetical protein
VASLWHSEGGNSSRVCANVPGTLFGQGVRLYVTSNICDSRALQRLTLDADMEKCKYPLLDILFRAGLALTTSALLLFVIFVSYLNAGVSEGAERPMPMAIPGKSMQAVVGSAQVSGEQLAFTAYHPGEDGLTAVAVWRGRFQAADFPLLRYQIESVFPGPELKLIWRTSSNPGVLYNTGLVGSDNGVLWLDLARNPDWQGTVMELGVYVFANAADQALTISHLTLEPLGWRGVLASHWSDWTSFRGWSTRSINFLYGTADRHALSPVLVAAAWSALAVTLLLIAGLLTGGWQPGALVAVLLLPWISVDLLWQNELMTQLTQTRDQFAGKTVHEKHLADRDSHIYRYIKRLKDELLPEASSRMVILHNSRGHIFDRLKAQYYLLPHNVYNFGRVPPKTGVDGIDYILVLGDIPNLEFRKDTDTLVWKHGKKTLPVELLDSDPVGRLYRVVPQLAGAEK